MWCAAEPRRSTPRRSRKSRPSGSPFDEELRAAGLTLVQVQIGSVTRPIIVPLIDDEPAAPDKIEALRREGKLSEEDIAELTKKIGVFSQRLAEVGEKLQTLQSARRDALRSLMQGEATQALEAAAGDLCRAFPEEKVRSYVTAVIRRRRHRRLPELDEDNSFTRLYQVNLIQSHENDETPPVDRGERAVRADPRRVHRSPAGSRATTTSSPT